MDPQNNETLNILYWNANSIRPKTHQLYAFMTENFIDIACLCETLLNPDDQIL